MNKSIIATSKIKIQKHFLKNEIVYIKNIFEIEANQKILFAVWTNSFSQTGFIITNEELYWNLEIKHSKNNLKQKKCKGKIKYDLQKKYNFNYRMILPEVIDFTPNEIKSEKIYRIEIKEDNLLYYFNFINLKEDVVTILTDILKYGLTQTEFPQINLDLIPEVKTNRVVEFICRCKNVFSITNKKEKKSSESKFLKNSEDKNSKKKNKVVNKTRMICANILDFFSSIILFSSIIMIVCTSLWSNLPDNVINKFTNKDDYTLVEDGDLKIEMSMNEVKDGVSLELKKYETFPPKIGSFRNKILIMNFSFFCIVKILVIILIKANLVLSILSVALSLLSCFFIKYKFLLFVIFLCLTYLLFQFICHFSLKSIFIKILLLVFCFFIILLILFNLLNYEIQTKFTLILSEIKSIFNAVDVFSVKWW